MLSDAQLEAIEEGPDLEHQVELDPEAEAEEVPMPARRLALMREMVVEAIGRYKLAVAGSAAVDAASPDWRKLRASKDPADWPEGEAWKTVAGHAAEVFDRAEEQLAAAIQWFHGHLAPGQGEVIKADATDYFVPRAVRHGGSTYTLVYSVNDYESGTNIVAVCRDELACDLGGP